MTKEHQGTAASLVSTTVKYSILLALAPGIADSAEMKFKDGGGRQFALLADYRAAIC